MPEQNNQIFELTHRNLEAELVVLEEEARLCRELMVKESDAYIVAATIATAASAVATAAATMAI